MINMKCNEKIEIVKERDLEYLGKEEENFSLKKIKFDNINWEIFKKYIVKFIEL